MNKIKNKWGQWVWADGDEGTQVRQQVHERYIRSLPVENGIHAVLKTYSKESLIEEEHIMLPEFYDGDQWGDTCPIVIGSNQCLEVKDD
jgi:hypothetical protein